MKCAEVKQGRSFIVTFEHHSDFFAELRLFCKENKVKQGYIPMFIAGFSKVELVGTCGKIVEGGGPIWDKVHLENVEACGCGTIAYDPEEEKISPHVHVSTGLKGHSATAHTSHLLSATVQYLVEMVIIEVLEPDLRRIIDPKLFDIALLSFEKNS